ncbi:phosphoenolpyruvate carboxykinase (ATP) [Puia dinghuensis]|uniref:Phosphoenolpyruvate carboxykinase (ATP) n=1 Tax=Puia dinghuensis TaxID=1792502 RepID=A0A8J2UHF9_9BACT|nr:phosphoenolpyruvate carboxykinase (ATP) [Puia dinghuensis]GGB16135.1 phosphoenolpyruvate carboxykinase [ATP] 2 [Puia dinghuensis]
MSVPVFAIPTDHLVRLGLKISDSLHYQLQPHELVRHSLRRKEGVLNDTGALVIRTGAYTGRSPKDRYIVKDELTSGSIHWNDFNQPIDEVHFNRIFDSITAYLNLLPELFVRDCYVCADTRFRLNIRVINELASTNLFAYNMFLRPTEDELENFHPDWQILSAPGLQLDAAHCGARSNIAVVISFQHRLILIAGTGYTGETKKAVFTILNYLLPHEKKVLSMHCSANRGPKGDTAIFFGLSGTGKTTLSADPRRSLIGDDEHGWTADNVFNFEGGCYAKCINLKEEKEPAIFRAIRPGALVENVKFFPGSDRINFDDGSITENTRVSYPLHYISNALEPSLGPTPKNIFFLTCDAYGVLPPISRLTPGQAMYQFISGYTAKVAGTETGITEPKPTFSACFGAPFLPLHPGRYAELLGAKMRQHGVKVWMVNTGWSGGVFGKGSRIPLAYTRAMITAALEGALDEVEYTSHPVFGMAMALSCPGVPDQLLHPRNTWPDPAAYDEMAEEVAGWFIRNFEKYADGVDPEILAAAPRVAGKK